MIYPGLLLQERYRVIKPMRRGGFGDTWEVDDGGIRKVLKVLYQNFPQVVELFKREAEVLSKLSHPGIPTVESDSYFTFSSEGSNELVHCLIMEKIEGSNLYEWLQLHQPISQEQALCWLKQLVVILAQVHAQNYFHRDIKPSNIMLRPDGQLVLIDFGAVRQITETHIIKLEAEAVTKIYSQGYTAPEQFRGQAIPQSDFFALGRSFIYLLTGKQPTAFEENPHTFELGSQSWRKNAPQVSKDLGDLIDELMEPSLQKRPQNAEEILYRLTILSIESSIHPSLEDLPKPLKFGAKQLLKHELQQTLKQIRTPKIALYGRAGTGKSSLINAILGERRTEVSVARRGTLEHHSNLYYRDGWKINFVDSRGVDDAEGQIAFQQAIEYIVNEQVDILLFVIPVDERNVQGDIEFLKALKLAHHQKHKTKLPVILVLNKIDRIEPGCWYPPYNLSLDSAADSRKPKTLKEAKEANIRECIQARLNEYSGLSETYVPICAKWNEWEDARYNMDELALNIYNYLPDEATRYGFGGAAADTSLKKAIASKFTSAAAWLAFFAVLVPIFDLERVLLIQKRLVSMIAQIAGTNQGKSQLADNFLRQLDAKPTIARSSALSTTLAIGEAAIHYFIDQEKTKQVKQTYSQQEKRLEPEFQAAFQVGNKEIYKRLKEIDAELHKRYGVKRIYDHQQDCITI
ncbi:MAG: protein kinase [Symploca sp. SIO2E9]|nr:protein kinase [Symploca sp. SIO2E9]